MSKRSSRGVTLGIVLMVVAIAVMAAFTLAGMAFSQLNLTNRSRNAHLARNAAESAIARTLDRLVTSRVQYGRAGETTAFDDPNGALGRVTFSAGVRVGDVPIPVSTHNWAEAGAAGTVRGFQDRLIGRDAVHLVSVGICGDVVKTIECIVHFPNYTYAIASRGPISVDNSIVGAVKNGVVPRKADGSVDQEELDPGSVVCNSASGNAIVLNQGSRVTGDAQTAGKVKLQNGSVVLGEVRQDGDVITLPGIDIDRYDPTDKQFVQELSASAADLNIEGYAVAAGDLSVSGDLRLTNGLVFVKQNLTVTGGIVGSGAVFVKGSATVGGATNLAGDEGIALVAGGNVRLAGTDRDRSFLRGLVYTRGVFEAARITLVGTFVSDCAETAGGRATVSDANLIHSSSAAVTYTFTPYDRVASVDGRPYLSDGSEAGSVDQVVNAVVTEVQNSTQQQQNLPPEQQEQPQEMQRDLFQAPTLQTIDGPGTSRGYGPGDHITDYLHKHVQYGISLRENASGQQQMVITMRHHGRGEGYPGENVPAVRSLLPGSPWAGYPITGLPFEYISIFEYAGPMVSPDGSYDAAAVANLCGSIANAQAAHIQYCNERFGGSYSVDNLSRYLQSYVAFAMMRPPQSQKKTANFRYDPNDYLTLADKMRIELWREIP